MTKKQREYIDNDDHKVMDVYYALCDRYNGRNAKFIKKQLTELIEKDQNFLDSYVFLHEILRDEGKFAEAEKILDDAYQRAINLITDKNGNWPDILEWGWFDNRHIIRAILNKAISFWINGEVDIALDLFKKLLQTNPGDNIGARYFILAIKMDMSFYKYESCFDKGGFYDDKISDWFDENHRKFPNEFGCWEKAIEKFMQ
jgi:tetratricopeptide (TPR) repeat protein